jgi:glycosyltransferase involved in cell wall biosynthesis
MKKPKLLIIAPLYVDTPLRGYEKLLKYHIEELVFYYDVDLVTLDRQGKRIAVRMDTLTNQVFVKSSPSSKFLGMAKAFISRLPFQCGEFCTGQFRNTIKTLTESKDYDRILCYMARTYPSVPKKLHFKTIVFAIDPLCVSYHLSARRLKFWMSIPYKVEGFLVKRLEKSIMAAARTFALISKYDARRQMKLFRPTRPVSVIRYGSKLASSNKPLAMRDSNVLVVSGSGFYPPNVRALKYLLLSVWPELQKLGNLQLHIIGSSIDADIESIAKRFPDVEVLGFVEDVYRPISNALASLCLVDLNVGVQTKVLEAMSCGTPVICSKASGNGVGACHNRDIMVANSPAEIAAAVQILRENPDTWKKISENSYILAKETHHWAGSVSDIIAVLK